MNEVNNKINDYKGIINRLCHIMLKLDRFII